MADQDHIQQLQQRQARVPFPRNPRTRASASRPSAHPSRQVKDDEGVGAAQSHLLVVPVQAPRLVRRVVPHRPAPRLPASDREASPQMACSSCSVRAPGHKYR